MIIIISIVTKAFNLVQLLFTKKCFTKLRTKLNFFSLRECTQNPKANIILSGERLDSINPSDVEREGRIPPSPIQHSTKYPNQWKTATKRKVMNIGDKGIDFIVYVSISRSLPKTS